MKRHLPIIIVFLGIIGIIVSIMLSNNPPSQPPVQTIPSPTPYLGVGFRGIDLNTATAGGVISVMGNPVRTDLGQNQKTLIYTPGVGNQPININTDANNKVDSVIEPSQPGTKLSVLQALLGKEDVLLYGNYYYSGYYLYTYLALGTAVLANPETDTVKERWYFPPVSLPAFLQTVGVGFQTSPLPSGRE
ncbi:MAG: hypothetical protein NTY06_01490 [Candidatus Gottesmanbacteria bacterium]|nr:hypothetical protein [Candidatus Gottesmanbacteria bacterium]